MKQEIKKRRMHVVGLIIIDSCIIETFVLSNRNIILQFALRENRCGFPIIMQICHKGFETAVGKSIRIYFIQP